MEQEAEVKNIPLPPYPAVDNLGAYHRRPAHVAARGIYGRSFRRRPRCRLGQLPIPSPSTQAGRHAARPRSSATIPLFRSARTAANQDAGAVGRGAAERNPAPTSQAYTRGSAGDAGPLRLGAVTPQPDQSRSRSTSACRSQSSRSSRSDRSMPCDCHNGATGPSWSMRSALRLAGTNIPAARRGRRTSCPSATTRHIRRAWMSGQFIVMRPAGNASLPTFSELSPAPRSTPARPSTRSPACPSNSAHEKARS